MTDSLMSTYARLPVTFAKGEGALLWDENGKEYVDAISGIAVCSLGHANADIAKAIADQASTLVHTSNLYGIAHQQALGDELTRLSGMDKAFFANSGAEANEAAIKLARLHGNNQGIEEPQIVVMDNSFHGRTMATLTATGNAKVHAGFAPLVQGFIRVPYGDLDAIKALAERKDVVAVLVEPVQGEGGVNIPPADYLPGIRQLCDENNWLMMLDEIQTGMSRTGKLFAFQHYGITPDVMTLAKALGNGMPIGACLANDKAAELFAPGNHGTTFGGTPLACRVGLEVCRLMTEDKLWERAEELGNAFVAGFENALKDVDGIDNIRGQGLMIGIQLNKSCGPLVAQALEQGMLINVTADNVIRLLPPIVMTDQQVQELIEKLSTLISDFLS